MSNIAKKILQETFSSWMKKITKEYQKKYGFDMGKNSDVTSIIFVCVMRDGKSIPIITKT